LEDNVEDNKYFAIRFADEKAQTEKILEIGDLYRNELIFFYCYPIGEYMDEIRLVFIEKLWFVQNFINKGLEKPKECNISCIYLYI
jgi:hypothetical protein